MKTDSSTDSSTTTAATPSKKRDKSAVPGTSRPASDVTKWIEALSIQQNREQVGPEWKTRTALEAELGLKRSALMGRLQYGMKEGRIECRKFRVARADGVCHELPHYRIIA
jgi:hypothetical protein